MKEFWGEGGGDAFLLTKEIVAAKTADLTAVSIPVSLIRGADDGFRLSKAI